MTNKSFSIDHEKRVITTTKRFMNNAARMNSEEAQTLLYWKQVFPNYRSQLREVTSDKRTHKRLTVDFMERYITMRADYKNAMHELDALKRLYAFETKTKTELEEIDKNEAKAIRNKEKADRLKYYTKIKAWFINKYPDYTDSIAFGKYIGKTFDTVEQS